MSSRPLAAVVLAAGLGTRMKSARPKVMHPVGGQPLIKHVLATLKELDAAQVVVVVGPGMDDVANAVSPHVTVVQKDRLGTGHAVRQAEKAMLGFRGDVLIVYGDTPFVSAENYALLREARDRPNPPTVVVMGFTPQNPTGYGRLIVSGGGQLERIVEEKDARPDEKRVNLCNSGIFLVDSAALWQLLHKVDNKNAKNEFYLTDIVRHARANGMSCAVVHGDEHELLGVNNRSDLADAEAYFQDRKRVQAMEGGATLLDPNTVYFAPDTVIGKDVEIGAHVVFGPGVTVSDNVVIKPYCHIEGAMIASGAVIGPFARLRPGAVIGAEAHIGNFVEIKNSTVEQGAKVNHLSYVGDAQVGEKANIGAGTITANYDGYNKSATRIGAGASIGSNSVLVAPVTIGNGAMTGAGAVVTQDVPDDGLAINSSRQEVRPGFARAYRIRKATEKAKKQRPVEHKPAKSITPKAKVTAKSPAKAPAKSPAKSKPAKAKAKKKR